MKKSIFFVLGAGASVDSGLPTYRGEGGLYNGNEIPESILNPGSEPELIWKFLTPFYQKIKDSKPGPTYEKLEKLTKICPNSFILTQNVDGYAKTLGIPVVEIHGNWSTMKCVKCGKCMHTNLDNPKCECGNWCRPNIVLFDEKLSEKEVMYTHKLINKKPEYIIIIGTTLQFPYLRTFIQKAKQKGGKVIHINPDENYGDKVKYNEQWIKKFSKEGLESLISSFNSYNFFTN